MKTKVQTKQKFLFIYWGFHCSTFVMFSTAGGVSIICYLPLASSLTFSETKRNEKLIDGFIMKLVSYY